MPNEAFKGTRVLIDKLSIAPGPGGLPVLGCSVQFVAEDGTVHAVAQHNFLLDSEVSTDGLAPIVADLLERVTKRVEAAHFSRPNSTDNPVLVGIAETLRARPAASDEPGTQG